MSLPPPPSLDPALAWALFLDVDGTLLELAPTPDAVVVPPSLPPLLGRLRAALDGALALVSGRPLSDLDALFGPLRLPGVGIHGLEVRFADGRRELPEIPERWAEARAAFARFVQSDPGLLLEDKQGALALHYRLAPRFEQPSHALVREWADRLASGTTVQQGKAVVELRSGRGDKGHGIRALLESPEFRGRRPAFLGDDLTDHAGFAAVNDLGGISVHVGTGPAGPARYGLAAVPDVHRWLTDLLARLEAPPGRA